MKKNIFTGIQIGALSLFLFSCQGERSGGGMGEKGGTEKKISEELSDAAKKNIGSGIALSNSSDGANEIQEKNTEDGKKNSFGSENDFSHLPFAECIKKSAFFYGIDWSEETKRQIEELKKISELEDVNSLYRNCDQMRSECKKQKVQGFPTWIIQGERYSDIFDRKGLIEKTGCMEKH